MGGEVGGRSGSREEVRGEEESSLRGDKEARASEEERMRWGETGEEEKGKRNGAEAEKA